jgi:hypothetical protein
MSRFLAFVRGLFPRFFPLPKVRWEDGVVHTDPRYAVWYAETVAWIREINPDAPIFAPDLTVTVRLYDRFPVAGGQGKVLAPNVIAGDVHGTLCLLKSLRESEWLFKHEAKHCITGESGHPDWLFS